MPLPLAVVPGEVPLPLSVSFVITHHILEERGAVQRRIVRWCPPGPCHPHALLVAASAGDMKPEAVLPSTVHASRKRPAIASAGAGKRLASDPLETKLSATRKGSFLPSVDPAVPPHTLLLGTQPSDNSLAHGQYFMTNANAFWHIVGGPACSKCLTRSSGPSRHPRGPPARSGLPSWVREESRPAAP